MLVGIVDQAIGTLADRDVAADCAAYRRVICLDAAVDHGHLHTLAGAPAPRPLPRYVVQGLYRLERMHRVGRKGRRPGGALIHYRIAPSSPPGSGRNRRYSAKPRRIARHATLSFSPCEAISCTSR